MSNPDQRSEAFYEGIEADKLQKQKGKVKTVATTNGDNKLPAQLDSSVLVRTSEAQISEPTQYQTYSDDNPYLFRYHPITYTKDKELWDSLCDDPATRFRPVILDNGTTFIDVSAPVGFESSNGQVYYNPTHRLDEFMKFLDPSQVEAILKSNPALSKDLYANITLNQIKLPLKTSLSATSILDPGYALIPEAAKASYEDGLAFASTYKNYLPAGTYKKRSLSSYFVDWLESVRKVPMRIPAPSLDFWSHSSSDMGTAMATSLISEMTSTLSKIIDDITRNVGAPEATTLTNEDILSKLERALTERFESEGANHKIVISAATKKAYVSNPLHTVRHVLSAYAGVNSLNVPLNSYLVQVESLKNVIHYVQTMRSGVNSVQSDSTQSASFSNFEIDTLIAIVKEYSKIKVDATLEGTNSELVNLHSKMFDLTKKYSALVFFMNMADTVALDKIVVVPVPYADMQNFQIGFGAGRKSLYGFTDDTGWRTVPFLSATVGYSPACISLEIDKANSCFSEETAAKRLDYAKRIAELTGINVTNLHFLVKDIKKVIDGVDQSDAMNRATTESFEGNQTSFFSNNDTHSKFKDLRNPFASELASETNPEAVALISEYLAWEADISAELAASRGFTSLSKFVDHWMDLMIKATGVVVEHRTEEEVYLSSINSLNATIQAEALLNLGANMVDFKEKLVNRSNKVVIHSDTIQNVTSSTEVPVADILSWLVARAIDEVTANTGGAILKVPAILNSVPLLERNQSANQLSWTQAVKMGNALDVIATIVGSYFKTLEDTIANWPSDVYSPDMAVSPAGEAASVSIFQSYVTLMKDQMLAGYIKINSGFRPSSLPSSFSFNVFVPNKDCPLTKDKSFTCFDDKSIDNNTSIISYVEDDKRNYNALASGKTLTLAPESLNYINSAPTSLKMIAINTLSTCKDNSYLKSLSEKSGDDSSAVNTVSPSRAKYARGMQFFFHEKQLPKASDEFQSIFVGRSLITMGSILQTNFFRALSCFFDEKRVSNLNQMVSERLLSNLAIQTYFASTKMHSEDADIAIDMIERKVTGFKSFMEVAFLAFEKKKTLVFAVPKFNQMLLMSYNFDRDDHILVRTDPIYLTSLEVFPSRLLLSSVTPLASTHADKNFVGNIVKDVSRSMALLGATTPDAYGQIIPNNFREYEAQAMAMFDMNVAISRLDSTMAKIDELANGQNMINVALGWKKMVDGLQSTDKNVSSQALQTLLASLPTEKLIDVAKASETLYKKKKGDSALGNLPRAEALVEKEIKEALDSSEKTTAKRADNYAKAGDSTLLKSKTESKGSADADFKKTTEVKNTQKKFGFNKGKK